MFDAFLKVTDIPGESTDDKHKDWIEILSYSWGNSQTPSGTPSSGGGASAERADFQDLTVTKAIDKATPKLALACADGTHIKEVLLALHRAGGQKEKYMEYKLTHCMITSVQQGGAAEGQETLPIEEVSFNYGKVELLYVQQKRADGSGGGQVKTGWDLEKNAKV